VRLLQPRRARRWLPRVAIVLLAMCALPARSVSDEAEALLERRVKAALLYRFTNYVQWPPSAAPKTDAAFTIGIAGADAVAAELTAFAAGRQVHGRPLAVRRHTSPDAFKEAQIVFVGRDDHPNLAAIIRAASPNALIVTESRNGLQQGSVINFIVVEGQVRFEISLQAALERNLQLSSRLLSVAYTVHTGAR